MDNSKEISVDKDVPKMNNKVEIMCSICGSIMYVSRDHFRHQSKDYIWRCKQCMSKHRSELMKASKNNIGNIINKKLEDPVESEKYLKTLSERGKCQWESKSDDEKKSQIKLLNEGNAKYYKKIPREKLVQQINHLKDYYHNRSPDEAQRHRQLISISRKKYFNNLSTDELRRYSDLYKSAWESKSEEEKKAVAIRSKQYWENLSSEQRENHLKNYSLSQKKRWDNMTVEDKEKISQKIKSSYSNMTIEEKELIRKRQQERWANMTEEEKYNILRQTFVKSNGHNKFHTKFEEYFQSSYLSRNYHYIPEVILSNNNIFHSWDYGIYDKSTNTLQMVIDLDGAYYHADNCDYDGLHSKEEYDEKRALSVSGDVKMCIIYENKFKQSFQHMIKLLELKYEDMINEILEYCRSIEFPYPKYSNKELNDSWRSLVNMKYQYGLKDISINTRIGDRIISHFHPSIYHAHTHGKLSPYEAWYNDELLRKVIENRIIYVNTLNPNKILQGFNISKIAPKVSVFSAGRAKILIMKYLNDMTNVFDPFSGFGGRMLGTVSLNKQYIGQDISDNHIRENINIVNFLEIQNFVSLKCNDILLSNGTYESLFTCPPYSDKEQWYDISSTKKTCDDWIDECINRFKCKKYLFVVDNTKKYKKYIVDEISNKSHFSNSSEKIILIKEDL